MSKSLITIGNAQYIKIRQGKQFKVFPIIVVCKSYNEVKSLFSIGCCVNGRSIKNAISDNWYVYKTDGV